jgi:hypothetical protein
VPRGLFGPLGDPYAELYWDLLASLYRYEFEREPFVVLRSVALELAEGVIRDSRLYAEQPDKLAQLDRDDDSRTSDDPGVPGAAGIAGDDGTASGRRRPVARSATSPNSNSTPDSVDDGDHGLPFVRGLARRMVSRLERSGWIHFQYRSGTGDLMSFHPYAARILETLLKVARDEQPVFQGYVHSIAALLEPRAFAQRPGVSLSEAKRHTLELVRELKILERNIHLFTQRILDEMDTAAAVLEEGFERYEHAVMANYHRLKTVDNVFRQRSAILERLHAIERDTAALGAAAEWYAESRGYGRREGEAEVASDLELLRSQFDRIPRLVEEIDVRNARFSGVALRRIRYFLRQDRRTEGQLQYIVDALARGQAPELEFEIFKCELLDDGFLYTPPTERERTPPQALVSRDPADLARIRREAAVRLRRKFSRRQLEEFVDTLLAGRSEAPLAEVPVEQDDQYVRLLYLASYGLDGGSSFRISPSPERVRKGIYEHPGGTVERSGRPRRGSTVAGTPDRSDPGRSTPRRSPEAGPSDARRE